ncbi:Uncharacterized protein OBRU01_12462 [Operophtera brumata]|uniref:Cuticle protein n=1 Tax=Operophtera brumata TaxID=104452 RepID=A0A0L7L9P6_OPEBR|nr:Uncharacterized protein OBRU01_12462 [Operophtera brumata]
MALKLGAIVVAMLHIAAAFPAITLEDLEVADDTMSVGSYVRETRAAPPENFHKSYQSEGDGEIGYSRKKNGGGKKGYQHFDSYHKKAGDNYEFEKQDSYGLDNEGKKGGHSHEHQRKDDSYDDDDGAYSHNHERKAERYREPESEDIDEEPPRRPAKKEQGRHRNHDHEELKEGAADGNGGVEAYGHNPDDYVLPEKYTYGSGEEYNF